jgi:hypothetical protein
MLVLKKPNKTQENPLLGGFFGFYWPGFLLPTLVQAKTNFFVTCTAQSGMLTLQETTDIFLNFTAKQKPVLEYPVKPRLAVMFCI